MCLALYILQLILRASFPQVPICADSTVIVVNFPDGDLFKEKYVFFANVRSTRWEQVFSNSSSSNAAMPHSPLPFIFLQFTQQPVTVSTGYIGSPSNTALTPTNWPQRAGGKDQWEHHNTALPSLSPVTDTVPATCSLWPGAGNTWGQTNLPYHSKSLPTIL